MSKYFTLIWKNGHRHANFSFQWSPEKLLKSASLKEHRSMNPCPVYERESKTVFLFFNCGEGKVSEIRKSCTLQNKARLCYIKSTDNVESWSKHTEDLMDRVIGDELKNWATFRAGPGHGIQLTDSNGSLIVPAYVYYSRSPVGKPYAFAFCSDDRGKTWHYGQRVSV